MTSRNLLALSLAATTTLAACGSDDDDPPAPPTAQVRVAHLSPGAPAVDLCIRAPGQTGFTGPVLKALGAVDGLPYATVTRYVDVPAAALTVRLVAPNAADCATSLAGLPDFGPLPALAAGSRTTVAATGLVGGTPAFGLAAYGDQTTVAAGQAKLRFVHASPGTPAVDVGTGSGASFAPLFEGVAFGGVDASVGPNGYLELAPVANATVSARATGTTADALVVPGVSVPAGAIVTAYAIGLLGGTPPLKVLVCADAQPAGLLSACTVAP